MERRTLLWAVLGILASLASAAEPVSFNTSAAVTSTDTVLVNVSLGGYGGEVTAQVINEGPSDLAAFRMDLRAGAAAEWYSYVEGSGWASTDARSPVLYCSTTPATLAAGGTANVRVDIGTAYGFRLVAACAADETATVSVIGTARAGDSYISDDPNKLNDTLPAAELFVGDANGYAAGAALTGDATITTGGSLVVGVGRINAYKLGYAPDSMILVQRGTTNAQSGVNLLASYRAAGTLTPGGNAQAYNNRAVVLVPPGVYALGGTLLTMDANFVTVAGECSDPSATVISATGGTTVYMTGTHARLANLTLLNSNATSFPYLVGLENLAELRPALRNVRLVSGSTYPDNTITVPEAGIAPVVWNEATAYYHGGSLLVDLPCDDTTDWTAASCAITADTTNWRRGGKTGGTAVRMTGTGTNNYSRGTCSLGGTFNMTSASGLIDLYIPPDDANFAHANMQYIGVRLIDTASKGRRFYLWGAAYIDTFAPRGWNSLAWYTPKYNSEDSGFDPSVVHLVVVSMDYAGVGPAPALTVDSIKIFAPARTKAVVCVHFDNAYQYEAAVLEKAAEYGIPITVACSWNSIGQGADRLTWEQVRRFRQMGHTFIWYPKYCSDDWGAGTTTNTLERKKLSLIAISQYWRDNGLGSVLWMSPPGTHKAADTLSLLEGGWIQGIVWANTPYDLVSVQPIVGAMKRLAPAVVGTGTDLSAEIALAAPGGGLVLRCCHVSTQAEQTQMLADLETIKAAVDGGTAVTCTIMDVYTGNIPD